MEDCGCVFLFEWCTMCVYSHVYGSMCACINTHVCIGVCMCPPSSCPPSSHPPYPPSLTQALVQVMCTYSDCPTTLEHCMGALVVMAVYNPSYLSDMQQHGLVQQVSVRVCNPPKHLHPPNPLPPPHTQLCDVLHTHALPPLHLSAAKLLALAAGQPTLRDDLAQHTACSLLCKLTATYAASTEQEALVHVVTGNEDGGGIQHGGGNEHGSGVLGSNVHGSKHDIDLYEHGQYKKKFRGKQRPVVYASMYSAATWLDACLLHPLVPGGMDDQSNAYTEGSNADIKGSNGDIEAAAAASFPPQPPQQHSLSLSPAPSATPSARTHPKTAAQPATVQPMTCTKRQVDRDVAFCAVVALMQVSSEEQGVVMLSALGYVKHLLMLLDAAVLDVPMQVGCMRCILRWKVHGKLLGRYSACTKRVFCVCAWVYVHVCICLHNQHTQSTSLHYAISAPTTTHTTQIIILQSISNMMVPSHPDAPLLLLSNNGLSTLCALATHRSRKRARCLGCSVTQGALECIAMLAGHADASVVHAVDAQVGAVLPVLQAHVGTRNEAAAGCAMAALAMLLSRRGNVGRIYKVCVCCDEDDEMDMLVYYPMDECMCMYQHVFCQHQPTHVAHHPSPLSHAVYVKDSPPPYTLPHPPQDLQHPCFHGTFPPLLLLP